MNRNFVLTIELEKNVTGSKIGAQSIVFLIHAINRYIEICTGNETDVQRLKTECENYLIIML